MEEITRPEEIEDNFPEPDPATYCKSCQSKWKPNRRNLILGTAAVIIGTLAPISQVSALTPEMAPVTISCEDQLAADLAHCNLLYPGGPTNVLQEFIVDACIHTANESYIYCLMAQEAAQAVAAIALALEHAAEIIATNPPPPGTVIVIGVVAVLFFACVVATEGLCAAVLLGAV